MRRTQAVSSDVVDGRVQARLRALHRARLSAAGPVVGTSAPPAFAHLAPGSKAAPREAVERDRAIAKNNGRLVNKMVSILERKPAANHDTTLLTAAAHATVEDAYRPGPIPLPKSLNKDARTRQLEQIVLENERFLARLIASPGVYNKASWERASGEEERYRTQIAKFPYQDPTTTVPQVNPFLCAIASAQTDKTAERILRQQQLLQQQQQQPFLPPLAGAPGFGQTQPHQSFSSTFGSTSASISPYPHAPLQHGNVPNHFPQAPPRTPGGVQPVPPTSSRPNTSAGAPRLRAQYTPQGVRVLRTASGPRGSSRPSTQESARRPKYQPLRQQQLQQQQQQQQLIQRHQEQMEAQQARASTYGQKAAEEQKQEADPAPPTDAAQDGAEADAATNASSSPPVDDIARPPTDGPVKLFEDTLVISGRAVLIKIFELASSSPSDSEAPGPWRLEVRVFDPWSALEYTLSLPLTYIRLCFYQVPDLLLASNRGFLLQTLLHYLAFAPAPGAHSEEEGLELLVDIVAPPPRTPAEAEAWTRAHDEAALEQAQTELDTKREEAERSRLAAEQRQRDEAEERVRQREREQQEFERLKNNPLEAAALLQQQGVDLEADAELLQPSPTPAAEPDAPTDSTAAPLAADAPPQEDETILIPRGAASSPPADSADAPPAAEASPPADAAAAADAPASAPSTES